MLAGDWFTYRPNRQIYRVTQGMLLQDSKLTCDCVMGAIVRLPIDAMATGMFRQKVLETFPEETAKPE